MDSSIDKETDRLFENLKKVGWTKSDCAVIAPMTLEINALKREKNAIILAHSYMTPDLIYGVADFTGDSYGLSREAAKTKAKMIVFCSVHFMAETAKILNPKKIVAVPAIAGCSLAESIKPEDVRDLRKRFPTAGVVCYVNTTAGVKAECDACCTSGNALRIVESMPQRTIIFLPDELMSKNLQPLTKKRIIGWTGRCVVHEQFTAQNIDAVRKDYPGAKVLAHLECAPAVVEKADMAGGTEGMLRYAKNTEAKELMLVTECGLSDRVRVEFPDKTVVGACALCPYMKKIMLKDVLQVLQSPRGDQIIELPEAILKKAMKALEKMRDL